MNRKRLLIIGMAVVLLVAALGGGAAYANTSLSATYSPQRAVTDYFAAQARGDVTGMMSNSKYLRGDGSVPQLFDRAAVTAMVGLDQNRQITNVKVVSTQRIDSSTSTVGVTLNWAGNPRSLIYTVRKDPSRVHYLFYDSWRLDIPYATINITLPNQPGLVTVDDRDAGVPPTTVQTIQGYHSVTMLGTTLFDANSQIADAVQGTGAVTFPTKLSASAYAAAAAAIKNTIGTFSCDPAQYFNCPNHAYQVQAGYREILKAVGGDIRAASSWSITYTGDPTTNMSLVVTTTRGTVTASGTCAMTLTVDGSKTYSFTGTWTATLVWNNGVVSTTMLESCDSTRA